MEKQPSLGRRSFLKTAGVGLGLTMVRPLSALPMLAPKRPLSPVDFKNQLRGPILSVPTTYTSTFKIDYQGMRNMIESAVNAGVRVFSLTNGNSQYDRLTYEEIKELTRAMVETVAGRGITLAATGPWWTGQVVDYARFAESIGADGVQVLMCANADANDDGHFEHYKTVANSTKLALVVHGQPSLPLMERLMTLGSIVGFKEEYTPDYTLSLYKRFGDRLNIFAGGGKARFLTYQPYGMQAYYSTFITFAPQLALRFWNAVKNNDLKAATDFVIKYDVPLYEGWSQSFWRASLECFGVAGRYMRPPQPTFSDSQMADVRTFYRGLGLHTNG
jgi:dihydrodipicolinate synthase/N-acetylneuraminate lyase